MNTTTLQFFCCGVERENLTVDMIFPDTPGDQLAVLGSKIKDRTKLILIFRGHHDLLSTEARLLDSFAGSHGRLLVGIHVVHTTFALC